MQNFSLLLILQVVIQFYKLLKICKCSVKQTYLLTAFKKEKDFKILLYLLLLGGKCTPLLSLHFIKCHFLVNLALLLISTVDSGSGYSNSGLSLGLLREQLSWCKMQECCCKQILACFTKHISICNYLIQEDTSLVLGKKTMLHNLKTNSFDVKTWKSIAVILLSIFFLNQQLS